MIDIEKKVLDNGLTILAHHDATTPLVTVNLLYDVGSRDEASDLTGFAHLFEHLMFSGSVNAPNFDHELQEVGAANNAFTNPNITNYYETLPAANIETALWLESDRMFQLDLSDKAIDVQKDVVIEEYKQRYVNQPYGDVWLLLRPLIYKTHPYKWPTIGADMDHVRNASRDDIKHFYNKFYTPNNCVISICGGVDANKAIALVEKWFGDIPRGEENVRSLPQEPKQTEERILEVTRKVPSNGLYIAYRMCDRMDDDYYIYDLITDLLAGGESSRFFQRLIKGKELFTDVSAHITGDVDAGVVLLNGKLKPGVSYEEAEQALYDELESLAAEVGEDELTKVKNKVVSAQKFGFLDAMTKAYSICQHELLGPTRKLEDESGRYQAVTADDIKRVCSTLTPESRSILRYRADDK